MWKEKVYTGSITGSTTTASITKLPDSATVVVNVEKTDLLNQKIVEFLQECGVSDVVYYQISGSSDSKKGNLFIYGTPFQFYVLGTNTYFTATSGNSFSIISGSSSTTICFSGTNYSIRICIVGNPLSSFGFAIGSTSYGGSAYSMGFLMVYKVQSLVDNSYWTFIQLATQTTSNLWLTKSDGTRPYNSALVTGLNDASNTNIATSVMNLFSNKYPLIPKFYSFFRLIDCYSFISSQALGSYYPAPATSYFAKIGDDTYMLNYYHGILLKC